MPKGPFGHADPDTYSDIYNNDTLGCCGPAGAGHSARVMAKEGTKKAVTISVDEVLECYEKVGGYVPGKPETDQGVQLRDLMNYWKNTGLKDTTGKVHKIDAYVLLNLKNFKEILLSTYLFGTCSTGVIITDAAMNQFENKQPWDNVKNATEEGGHFAPTAYRFLNGNYGLMTWAELQEATERWMKKNVSQAFAPISFDILDQKGVSPEGFDKPKLLEYLNSF